MFQTPLVSSIVFEVIRIVLGLLFYENILSRKEAPKCKTSGFHPFIGFCAQKIVAFVVFCLPNSVLLVVFT